MGLRRQLFSIVLFLSFFITVKPLEKPLFSATSLSIPEIYSALEESTPIPSSITAPSPTPIQVSKTEQPQKEVGKEIKKASIVKKPLSTFLKQDSRIKKLEAELTALKTELKSIKNLTSATKIAPPPPELVINERSEAYDQVPHEQKEAIVQRLKSIEQLIQKHGRAYDYRVYTIKQLEHFLSQLEDESHSYLPPVESSH